MARADRLYNLTGCFRSFVAVFSIYIYVWIYENRVKDFAPK